MDSTDTLHADATDTVHAKSSITPAAVTLDVAALPSIGSRTARQQRLAVDDRVRTVLAHVFGLSDWAVGDINFGRVARRPNIVRLRLRWGTHTASLLIDADQHPGLLSAVHPGNQAHTHADAIRSDAYPADDSGLRTAVAAILLASLPAALERLGMPGVDIVDVAFCRDLPLSPVVSVGCGLTYRHGKQRIDAVVEDIDDSWLAVLEDWAANQCTPLASHISAIAVPGRLQIGEKHISLKTLESLRAGDVILRALPNDMHRLLTGQATDAHAVVAWGHYGVRRLHAVATLQDNRFTLIQDPIMSHDTPSSAPMFDNFDSPVPISHLDLPLKIEIDTVSLPVSQLSALRAGYVLELPTSVQDARLRLVTYGQTIGYGELVSVGDHLGVRLVQLSHPLMQAEAPLEEAQKQMPDDIAAESQDHGSV